MTPQIPWGDACEIDDSGKFDGRFGSVMLAKYYDSDVVVKFAAKSVQAQRLFILKKIPLMLTIRHPHIVQVFFLIFFPFFLLIILLQTFGIFTNQDNKQGLVLERGLKSIEDVIINIFFEDFLKVYDFFCRKYHGG